MANIIGLITVNQKDILEVDADPSAGAGTPAARGSMAMYDSGAVGSVFIKTGTADTAWQQIDVPENYDWTLYGNILTGATFDVPDQFMGSTNNYDVIFRQNNVERMRVVAQGLLIGLNASIGGRLQLGVASLGDEIFKQSSPNGGSGAIVSHVTRQYKVQTTDATLTSLATLAIPTDSVMYAKMTVVSRQHSGSGGSAGDGAAYVREVHARNVGGVCTIRKLQTSFTGEDAGAFDVAIDIVPLSTNIRYRVQGDANRNMAWSAHTEIMIATN